MNKETKTMVAIAIAVAVILFVAGMIINHSRDKANSRTAESDHVADTQQNSGELTSASSTDATATSTPTSTVAKPKPAVTSKTSAGAGGAITESYADALKAYSASGYRLQIVNCASTPNSLTLKKGIKFMIDNRDSTTHKIKVDTTTYTVKGYGYVVATAGKIGSTNLYCDGRNVAKIVIEK
jgi:hypothetical protein